MATKFCRLYTDLDEANEEVRRLRALIDVPHDGEFFESARLEAAHQRQRWGEDDAVKRPISWFWVAVYLAAKAYFSFTLYSQNVHSPWIENDTVSWIRPVVNKAMDAVYAAWDTVYKKALETPIEDAKTRHRVVTVAALAANWHASVVVGQTEDQDES